MRFAIIDLSSFLVVNVTEWEGDTETWQPPEGCHAVASESANIGDSYDDAEGFKSPGHPAQPAVTVVTMRQARLALHFAGKLAAVNAAVKSDPVAQIEWDYADKVDRSSPVVAMLAGAIGLDDAALDDLFTHAATL